jgi:hypothetical protein
LGDFIMTRITCRFARLTAHVVVLGGALAVSACVSTGGTSEGIGFREARFAEMSAIRGWQSCRDEALELDRQAREEASGARYLAAARLLETCEANVGPEAAKVPADERMRAYALSAQNYFKGGDVPKARETLENLKDAYPGSDLYYPNGASFIETMEFLTGVRDPAAVGMLGIANIDDGLKSELRRTQYWKRN